MTILEITAWSFGSIIAVGTLLTWIHDAIEARLRQPWPRPTTRARAAGRRRTPVAPRTYRVPSRPASVRAAVRTARRDAPRPT